jgi:hypothetical protein
MGLIRPAFYPRNKKPPAGASHRIRGFALTPPAFPSASPPPPHTAPPLLPARGLSFIKPLTHPALFRRLLTTAYTAVMQKPKEVAEKIIAAVVRYSTEAHQRDDPVTIPAAALRSIVKDRLNQILNDVACERRQVVKYGGYLHARAASGGEAIDFAEYVKRHGTLPAHST